MKTLDFLLEVNLFKSKGEAIRSVKNKITLKINDIIIDESNINGYIYIEDGVLFLTNFNVKDLVD